LRTYRHARPTEGANGLVSALLCAGDHVGLGHLGGPVYQIVHISQQKAWVRPLRNGTERLVETSELRLILTGARGSRLAH
jgi:hypothetical protein